MRKRVEGRMAGHRIAYLPLREVMPAADANPWLWFAWDDGGDLLVAGVRTKADLEAAMTYPARANTHGGEG
jgi:hypothetical protein